MARESHDEAFEKIDCLKCGNCCKVAKPVLSTTDISRIAKHLHEPPRIIKEKYLKQDEDGNWTINASPCPFLGEANECQVYSARPSNCKGFPFTHKPGFTSRRYQHTSNTVVCPAAYYVVERMKMLFHYR
ncbi:MAG: YkgJ family cysteine cluster protein [Lewinella sp.]|uniref:YkgJ family cysteine cluster protein n=1 Tax=Lewinella sp. TaxID=2004506 RepID=UPI003D6C2180